MKKRSLIIITALLAATALWTGACSAKKSADSTQAETAETTALQTEAETTQEETAEETSAEEETKSDSPYSVLQGTIKNVKDDGSFVLQSEDEEREISFSDIRDVEMDIEEGKKAALVCVQDTMLLLLPDEEEWEILTVSGETTSNAMSSFSVKTAEGTEMSFLKDNCPVEAGALSADSGDEVEVVYLRFQGTNFPLEVKKTLAK